MTIYNKKNGWRKGVVSALLFFLLMGPIWPLPQELSPDEEQAIVDAKTDTREKVPFEWSLLNAALPLIGFIPKNEGIGCVFSGAVGVLGLVLALTIKPHIPNSRIIGKSPIYIETYSRVYRENLVQKRVIYTMMGGCTSIAIVLCMLLEKAMSNWK